MPERSAGILMYRRTTGALEVLLVHPGGPFWARKDDGAWSIPKGLYDPGEAPIEAAKREFAEETGFAPEGCLVALGDFAQPSRKVITAFAVEGDLDAAGLRSNQFEMEWPPKSGRMRSFPEVDRGAWFDLDTAARKILAGQQPILTALLARVADEDA